LLAILTVVGSTIAVNFFDNRGHATDPNEPFLVPTPTNRTWEARQKAAQLRSVEEVPLVKEVLKETPTQRGIRLGDKVPQLEDIKYSYFLLNNPIIKAEENLYGTVRFMHKKHAGMLKDCFVCHHHRPADLKALETTRCSACHQRAFNPELPGRIGLKGVHHRQCMHCHNKWKKGPVGCTECHPKNVPDHNKLVKLSGRPKPTEVIKECLRCHDAQAEEMLTSTHWLWKGPSPFTEGGRVEF